MTDGEVFKDVREVQTDNAWRPKRKMPDVLDHTDVFQMNVPVTPSKRPCLWHQENASELPSMTEQDAFNLPGCLNDSSANFHSHNVGINRVGFPANGIDAAVDMEMEEDGLPLMNNNNHQQNNNIMKSQFVNGNHEKATNITNTNSPQISVPLQDHSMDMDGSSEVKNSPGPVSSSSLSPRSVLDNTTKCNFLSCSGMRPSLVSGRMYCHCSASWRGLYGMDYGYTTDYY